jgi:hypothetical protein
MADYGRRIHSVNPNGSLTVNMIGIGEHTRTGITGNPRDWFG